MNETAESMYQEARSLQKVLEQGVSRQQLQTLLPVGGARNAIDCALWDLECKLAGQIIFG